jgi:hypothetical protein
MKIVEEETKSLLEEPINDRHYEGEYGDNSVWHYIAVHILGLGDYPVLAVFIIILTFPFWVILMITGV